MNTHKLTFAALAATAVVMAFAIAPAFFTSASAAITTKCTNPSGNEPQGNCNGNALTKTNVNPAGHAPPGQNP
ncbi:MAG: hypothetical protein M3247_09000 [Thermoproteota archaeon]|nr:hypothetical protein [Thermoproteota archaeon]